MKILFRALLHFVFSFLFMIPYAKANLPDGPACDEAMVMEYLTLYYALKAPNAIHYYSRNAQLLKDFEKKYPKTFCIMPAHAPHRFAWVFHTPTEIRTALNEYLEDSLKSKVPSDKQDSFDSILAKRVRIELMNIRPFDLITRHQSAYVKKGSIFEIIRGSNYYHHKQPIENTPHNDGSCIVSIPESSDGRAIRVLSLLGIAKDGNLSLRLESSPNSLIISCKKSKYNYEAQKLPWTLKDLQEIFGDLAEISFN